MRGRIVTMSFQTVQSPPADWREPIDKPNVRRRNEPGFAARILAAVFGGVLPASRAGSGRPRSGRRLDNLPPHLRRDVGLPPVQDVPHHWDYF